MIDLAELPRKHDRYEKLVAKIYTAGFVSDLAKEFGISDPTQIANLATHLREAGKIYLFQSSVEKAALKLPARKVKAQFEYIKKTAISLKASLESMPDLARNLFWAPLRDIPLDIYFTSKPSNYFGYPVARYRNTHEAVSTNIPNEVQVRNVISLVANLSEFAIKCIRADKSGRRSSTALWMWVSNMREFWIKGLDREFTYLWNKTGPVTQAHCFCVAVFKPLDRPNVRLIGSVMREVIRNEGVMRERAKKQKPQVKNRRVSARESC